MAQPCEFDSVGDEVTCEPEHRGRDFNLRISADRYHNGKGHFKTSSGRHKLNGGRIGCWSVIVDSLCHCSCYGRAICPRVSTLILGRRQGGLAGQPR